MNRVILLISLFYLSVFTINAQEFVREFGLVTQEDLSYSEFPDEPDASAVVLFDVGLSTFIEDDNGSFDIKFTRHKRFKILKNTDSDVTEVEIRFYKDGYGRTERIEFLKAHSVTIENGQLVKTEVTPSEVYEEQLSNSWFVKKFAFPKANPGAILEYKYNLITPFHFNLPDWEFQDFIPTLYSEYKVKLIPWYEYVFILNGINRFDTQESVVANSKRRFGGVEFKDYIHTYALKNIPSFQGESYITSVDDYIMKLDFQLAKVHQLNGSSREIITTWPKLSEDLLDHSDFGKYIKKSESLAKTVFQEELSIEGLSQDEKAVEIIEYVKNSYSMNNYYGKFTTDKPKDIYKTKSGSVPEINLLTIGLLQAAGVNARPVILSTRGNGKVSREYPFSSFFNYVTILVEMESGLMLSDASDHYTNYNRLPIRCLNDHGLIVQVGEPQWISLNTNVLSINEKSFTIIPKEVDASASVQLGILATEYEAINYRSALENNPESFDEFFLENGIRKIESVDSKNFNQSEKPGFIQVVGTSEIELIGDKMVVSPFLDFPISTNSLKANERSYPVDFVYPSKDSFISIINIPEGYVVAELPKDFNATSAIADVNYTCEAANGKITVRASSEFKKAIYQPSEYKRVKYYMDKIVENFNQQIVLQKI